MADQVKAISEEELQEVSGGRHGEIPHWQNTAYKMGEAFPADGYVFYRIKPGDTLGSIAAKYGTTIFELQRLNPKTITSVDKIYAGDCIAVRRR